MKNIEWLMEELRVLFQVSDKRREVAEGLIRSTERELKREITDPEARVVLSESSMFPEVNEDMRKRVINVAGEWVKKGELLDKPSYIEAGEMLARTIVLGRERTREGD